MAQYAQPVENVPPNAAVIIDAMAMLQSLASPASTFGELAKQIFDALASSLVTTQSCVDFVIDRYPLLSIKESERQRRQNDRGTIRVHILSSSQKLPVQWKIFFEQF